jgi:hypothetical protein
MNVYTYEYDHTYDPAMPVVDVVMHSLLGSSSGPHSALVDSGSDTTSVPLDLLDEIGSISVGDAVMSGIWGERRPVKIHLVILELGSHKLHGIVVAGVPNHVGLLLGRNVLNHVELTLNGPAAVVEIPAP